MRRREISPEFWRDERVWALSDAAKLLLPGIWQLADRAGRLLDKPFNIGVECRPWDVQSVAGLLMEIVATGLLVRYEVDGIPLLAVPPKAWKTHQHPHPKEVESKLPGIPWELTEGQTRGAPRSDPGSTKVRPNQSGSSGLQAFGTFGTFKPSGPSGPDQGAPKVKKPKASKKEPVQASLPDVVPPPPPLPPKPPTRIGKLHAYFQQQREYRFTDAAPDGLGLPPPPPDQEPKWGLSAAALSTWVAMFPTDWTEAEVDHGIEAMIRAWLQEPYWAEPTDKTTGLPSTPYPWGAFITDKQWRKALGATFPELLPETTKAGAA